MANPVSIDSDITKTPQTFASPGDKNRFNNGVGFDSRLSGPQYLSTITPKEGKKYCLDLSGKYNKNSQLKQYHCATFVFRGITPSDVCKQNEGAILTMALPNKVKYSFGGRWQNQFASLSGGSEALVGGLVQSLTNGSFNGAYDMSTASSWVGAQELSMILSFPVFDDVETNSGINYQEALALLAEATLPSVSSVTGAYTKLPGPTVFNKLTENTQGDEANKIGKAVKGAAQTVDGWTNNALSDAFEWIAKEADLQSNPWQRITLQLGGVLLLDWCIIKRVSVEFPNTKHQVLHSWPEGSVRHQHLQPLLANIEVEISTAQGLTVDKFKDMLQLSEGEKRKYATQAELAAKDKKEAAQKIAGSLNETSAATTSTTSKGSTSTPEGEMGAMMKSMIYGKSNASIIEPVSSHDGSKQESLNRILNALKGSK